MESKVDVLVIDDNRESADLMTTIVELLGHSASPYYSGEDGLAAIRSIRPKLVITDIVMHGMSGFDVLEAVRQIDPTYRPYMVSISAWSDPAKNHQIGKEKFDVEFSKPVGYDAIEMMLALIKPDVL